MNEGESATDLKMIFNLKHYDIQITHTIKYAQLVLAYETQKY